MNKNHNLETWKEYVKKELHEVRTLIQHYGYTLADEQPHSMGERYVMRAMTTTSGEKLVLVGHDSHGTKVIIKTAHDTEGVRELEHERATKKTLKKIRFGYEIFKTPKELLHVMSDGRIVVIYEFIEQKKPFLTYSNEGQFYQSLGALKAQEAAHATTHTHLKEIKSTFETFTSETYLTYIDEFYAVITTYNKSFTKTLDKIKTFFQENKTICDQYGHFLTHVDFVPHNFRIAENGIYLLDFSSLRFGNKYEGWARFLNYMSLYNPTLEQWLVAYVEKNRTAEEHTSLKLMRLYRLLELISFYIKTLEKADTQLHTLNTARIYFWFEVLQHVWNDTPLPEEIRNEYKQKRDSLRTDEERYRQEQLH